MVRGVFVDANGKSGGDANSSRRARLRRLSWRRMATRNAATPASTYRLQFSGHLNFAQARDLVTYFEALGIGAVYASPCNEQLWSE